MGWEPTSTFLRGKIVKPFLPFEKHPDLINDKLQNLYPGDEVYIFETKNSKWARGYVLSRPFPHDFTITSVNLDELPTMKIKVLLFPLKFVEVMEKIPFNKGRSEDELYDNPDAQAIPSIQDSEMNHKFATDGVTNGSVNLVLGQPVPMLPVRSFNTKKDTLLDELKYTLNLLTAHIFALYSIGEFRLFNKLSENYFNLDEVRVKLNHNLLTVDEIQLARETVTFILDKIPKKLASKSARLNEFSYDLDNVGTDISGYKAILARDGTSGELLNTLNSTPSEIASNQVFASLQPNFPINYHTSKRDFDLSPKPNAKLVHEQPSHILVDFNSVSGSSAYQPPGFAGMTAYMYIRNNRKRLTEAFAVHTDSVNDLVHVEKISAALFRNIPSSETENTRVYLVAVLTEDIDLNLKESSSTPQVRRVKKGVAAGVTDITRIFSRNQGSLASGESHQFVIRLYGSYVNQKRTGKEAESFVNGGWGETVDRIIAGSSHGIAINPRAEKLTVAVKEFKHQFTTDASSTNNALVNTATPIARIKPIFFDPLAENYERIYLRMGKVHLLNSITKDDLLTFEVSTPNNDLVTFAKASNQQEKRSWQFVSVFPDEVVGEIIKVNGISIKNPSKKMPKEDYIMLYLYVNGNLAGEGKLLYKSGNRLVEFNKKKSHIIEIASTTHKLPMAEVEVSTEYIGKVYNSDSSIDSVFQYERYFKSGQKGLDELANALVSFTKLDTSQLVKYFPELLTALYGIVETCNSQAKSPSVEILLENTFKAMVHLLDTIFGKQDQYSFMLDLFVARQASRPCVGVFLFNRISEVFSRAESNWNAISRSLCRVIPVVIRLAVTAMKDTDNVDDYFNAIHTLFKSVSFFLSIHSPSLISDQVLILEVVDYILTFNTKLDDQQTLNSIVGFIDSIGVRGLGANEDVIINKKPVVVPKDHKIIISKLLLIHRLFATSLAKNPKTLPKLISRSVTWSMEVLLGPTDIDASRLACTVLNQVCKTIWDFYIVEGNEDVNSVCYSLAKLLPAMSRTFIRYNKFTRNNDYLKPKRTFTFLFPNQYPFKENSIDPIVNDEAVVEILIEVASVFCFIAKIGKKTSGNDGYAEILSTSIEDDFFVPKLYLANDFQNEDLITLMTGVRLIRQGKFFPEDKWLTLYATLAEGCLTALELIRPLMIAHHIPPIDRSELFDRVLWGNYLKNLLKIATLQPVAVEHLSDVPRKACLQITADVRDRVAYLVDEAWNALAWDAVEEDIIRFNLKKFGGYQVEFISSDYSILQFLMLFALQNNADCQAVAVKILWSIMVSEYILSDSVIDVERECLVGLHDIYNSNTFKPGVPEQKALIEKMKTTIRLDREDEAFGLIYNFIETIQGFLLVLNDLNSVPVGPEFEDDRTFHKLNINAYLKNANKPELFHSFINQMFEENVRKNDFIQAALSLELLASTYSWDHHITVPVSFKPKFPEQSSFERKEALYKMIAQNYIKGNSLERATDTYNELLDSYHEHTFDLKSFAYVHNKLAKLYLDLEGSDKLTPSFFRVGFIGAGFPSNIRGKEQIYEGLPFEHITSIHERLLRLYPGARIISDDTEAQKLKEKLQTGRYLYVTTVEPISEISDKLFNTSIGVRQYARNKDLRFFTTMKRIPGSSSVFDLWTEETTFETYLSFPTLMNRSEIKNTTVVKLSPLDNAIRTVIHKNEDLIQLESLINMAFREKADYTTFFNDLSRQLAGTVDSPVNGGVGQYRTFFHDAKYLDKEEYTDSIRILKNAFNDLTLILSRCLHLHGKLVAPNIKASHNALVSLYKKNFKDEIEALHISTDYENVAYNHNINHTQPQYNASVSDKRSISASSGVSNGNSSSINGSRLTKSTSRTSSASSGSGLSGLSSERNSVGNSFASGNNNYTGKRTALNWRNMVSKT